MKYEVYTSKIEVPRSWRRLEVATRRRAIRRRIWAAFSWNPRLWRRRYLAMAELDAAIKASVDERWKQYERELFFGVGTGAPHSRLKGLS